jgi:hypothetical protein
MADLKELRLRLTAVLVLLGVIGVVAAGILLSPIGNSSRSGQRQLAQLWTELRAKERVVIPLRGIDQKVVAAQGEIATFYKDRVPSSYASISERLGRVAQENGVRLAADSYKPEDSQVPGLQRILIDASISGDYIQIVKFINALEREKMLFLVDGIALGEQQGGSVHLQITMETYMRGA